MQDYFVKTNFPDVQVIYCASIDDCLKAVMDGKAGCTTLNGVRANDMLKNRSYRSLSAKQQNIVDDRCFGVHLDNAGLLKLFNRGISIVGSERAQNMAYKYVDGLYSYTFVDTIHDNLWFVVLIAFIIFSLIFILLLRESTVSKRRVLEREASAKELEESNRQLAKDGEDKAGGDAKKIPEFMYSVTGLNVEEGIRKLGDDAIYIDTAKTYQETVESTAAAIEDYWEKRDITNVTTKVHAIKSTSRLIGALEGCEVPEEERSRTMAVVKAISDFDYDDVLPLLN